MTDWIELAITRQHERDAFDCGVTELNEYLMRFARQNHDNGIAKTYVLSPVADQTRVVGYYSVRAGQVDADVLPPSVSRGLPQYPAGVICLARLAVDLPLQGQGVGQSLLALAAQRSIGIAADLGVVGMEVDAIDMGAAAWYQRQGALQLLDDPLHLFFSLASLEAAFASQP
ncbi:MAG: GNAT family N-acetyltransferase [Chloroflexi bacterium]|nr:GNAT family N-acetyltransferase [Chloroflexota bacterium]